MRLYIHKENVLLLLANAGLATLLTLPTMSTRAPLDYFMGVIVALMFVLTLVRMWKFRHDKELEDNIYKRTILEIGEGELTFPRGYYFRHSSIHKTRRIPATIITEMNVEQWPPACVINDNEVIFLKSEQKDELIDFANRNGIPVADRKDLWSNICEPFLDTAVTEEQDKIYLGELKEGGISQEETIAIRKKIKWSMIGLTYIRWEWLHYGHQDVLMANFHTKKKYWWTMEIALRNYKKIEMPA